MTNIQPQTDFVNTYRVAPFLPRLAAERDLITAAVIHCTGIGIVTIRKSIRGKRESEARFTLAKLLLKAGMRNCQVARWMNKDGGSVWHYKTEERENVLKRMVQVEDLIARWRARG